ncbi:hypothetical protein PINS_up007410 [Pythium insidiosum]|nr:hypothetical protein PINS_up007410 [Pythium insidiosum]
MSCASKSNGRCQWDLLAAECQPTKPATPKPTTAAPTPAPTTVEAYCSSLSFMSCASKSNGRCQWDLLAAECQPTKPATPKPTTAAPTPAPTTVEAYCSSLSFMSCASKSNGRCQWDLLAAECQPTKPATPKPTTAAPTPAPTTVEAYCSSLSFMSCASKSNGRCQWDLLAAECQPTKPATPKPTTAAPTPAPTTVEAYCSSLSFMSCASKSNGRCQWDLLAAECQPTKPATPKPTTAAPTPAPTTVEAYCSSLSFMSCASKSNGRCQWDLLAAECQPTKPATPKPTTAAPTPAPTTVEAYCSSLSFMSCASKSNGRCQWDLLAAECQPTKPATPKPTTAAPTPAPTTVEAYCSSLSFMSCASKSKRALPVGPACCRVSADQARDAQADDCGSDAGADDGGGVLLVVELH